MEKPQETSIEKYFGKLEDPRSEINRQHKLIDILSIAICAVICGADDYPSIAEFGEAKKEWLSERLELPAGIPSSDTFWRVFRILDAEVFSACFCEWMKAVCELTRGEVIAIDGKQLRRSHDKPGGKSAIYMVSAWATANKVVLGQWKVDDKSNEITAIPELLRLLDIQGAVVTIDAMGAQTEIAQRIVANEADYLLSLKGNQGNLHEDVAFLFEDLAESHFEAFAHEYAKTVDKAHGRLETREVWTISDPDLIQHLRNAEKWPKLTTIMMVQAQRTLVCGDTKQNDKPDKRFYIASYKAPAETMLNDARSHWGVENGLHWTLDIAFREDNSRLRKDNSAQNFAVLRQIALNLLKQESTLKLGIHNKRLKAGWDNHYLLKVLSGLFF